MSSFRLSDILWRAQRHGQDWRDTDITAALDWMTAQIPSDAWQRRIAQTHARFQAAKQDWANGLRGPLYDPKDRIAWYLYQARRYADPALRPDYFEPEGYRIAPVIKRIGTLLPHLRRIEGIEDRLATLMTKGRSQPDDGIYEILVAGAYACRGWEKVSFVPEAPGIGRRPEFLVERGRSSWAVECKRTGRSDYAHQEREAGKRLADGLHAVSGRTGRGISALVRYTSELTRLDPDYLADKAREFLKRPGPYEWQDEAGAGAVFDTETVALDHVLETDDVYFGSSRMIELLLGTYEPTADFSVAGDWHPAPGRPLHATAVDRVSLVGWSIVSEESARRKARHFRKVVADAAGQLPADRPGVVHVGYETLGGNSADGLRDYLNRREIRRFDARDSRLRFVYANYFMPEHVTAQNESCAITETMVPYRVGRGGTRSPLAGHLLFDDGPGQPGSHLGR